MTLPLYMQDTFGYPTGIVLMTVIGFFFGFVLERSGFGRATILAGQFYFTNMRVLKVMFSAVVTAMLGLTLLEGLGVLDLSLVAVPPAYLVPQLAGGLLVGAGFVVSGYCPGTSVVAAASGHRDGVLTLVGIVAGSLLFGLFYPLLEPFYLMTPIHEIRFPELLGLPAPVVALGVVLMAVGAFLGGEKVERIFAKKNGEEPPDVAPRTRNGVFALMGAAAALALVTMALPASEPAAAPAKAHRPITPTALAQAIVSESPRMHLVDLRDPATCAAGTIPGALCLTADDPDGAFLKDLPPTRPLVLFGDGDITAVPEPARRFGGELLLVPGGYPAFRQEVLTAPAPPAEADPAALADYRLKSALHGHFTGAASAPAAARVAPKTITRTVKKGGGC